MNKNIYTVKYTIRSEEVTPRIVIAELIPVDDARRKFITIDGHLITVYNKPVHEFTNDDMDLVGTEDTNGEPLFETYDMSGLEQDWLLSTYAEYIAAALVWAFCNVK